MQTLQTYVNNEAVKLIDQSQTMTNGLTPTNETVFSALFTGGRYGFFDGGFGGLGYDTGFWSSTESGASLAYGMSMYYDDSAVVFYDYYKGSGLSIRCLKD